MLDKRTTQLLLKLMKYCQDGSYKIIEKTELAPDKSAKALSESDRMISFLRDNELIDIKYTDDNVYCLTVMPKGRTAIENMRFKNRETQRLSGRTMCIMIVVCTLAAFVGAFLGTLVAGLI